MNRTMYGAASAALLAACAQTAPRALTSGVRADASPTDLINGIQTAFEQFKAQNDARLAQIEARGSADVVTTDQVNAINASIDEMNEALAALRLNGSGGGVQALTPDMKAYATAFNTYFRTGSGESELKALAVKASVTRTNDPGGGYMVSPEWDSAIDRILGTMSAMRSLATVRAIGSATFKKLVGQGGAGAGWVGEQDARPATNTPQLAVLQFPAMTLYANPAVTQEMLDDASFDVVAWLADEVSITYTETEGAAYVNGDGQNKPDGLFSATKVADANWAWGKIGYVGTGGATLAADAFFDITGALKQGFRPNASWLMNRTTEAAVRKLKDSENRYLWEPSLKLGAPTTLLGYPLYTDDNVADVASNAYPVAFGDFKRGYLIVDRAGVNVLRDPYSQKGFVSFYTTKRVGGGIQHYQAIKFMKCA